MVACHTPWKPAAKFDQRDYSYAQDLWAFYQTALKPEGVKMKGDSLVFPEGHIYRFPTVVKQGDTLTFSECGLVANPIELSVWSGIHGEIPFLLSYQEGERRRFLEGEASLDTKLFKSIEKEQMLPNEWREVKYIFNSEFCWLSLVFTRDEPNARPEVSMRTFECLDPSGQLLFLNYQTLLCSKAS